jgi:superfamily II DNA or RNA helicase
MIPDIRVYKHDELYVRIEADRSIQYELLEHFSFFVNGYKFMPQYRSGNWDGKIRLFNIATRLLPAGLLIDLVKFCEKYDYSFELVDKEKLKPINFKPDIEEFLSELPAVTKMPPKGEYQYQLDAVLNCLKLNKALVLSPTGSGKSHIIYLIVRFLLRYTEHPILICVPTTSLVEQMVSDFASYANDDFDAQNECHKVYSGKEKLTNKRVMVTTWQSVYKLPKEWFTRFGAFICDEAHQADSGSITKIIGNLAHAPFRFGFTGTLDGSKTHELSLRGMFGPVLKTTTTKQLMDVGVLAKLDIDVVMLRYTQDECKHVAKNCKKYQDEIKWLVDHDRRNKFIIATAFSQPRNTLVLFNFVEGHGEGLHKYAKERAHEFGKEVFFVHGNVKVEEREYIRRLVEQQDNIIIFASYGTFSTGINMKNLHSVIFAHPFKARVRNLQSIGRTLRKSSGKESAKLIDIGDDLTYNGSRNVTLEHLVERLKIYEAEQFEYIVRKRDL